MDIRLLYTKLCILVPTNYHIKAICKPDVTLIFPDLHTNQANLYNSVMSGQIAQSAQQSQSQTLPKARRYGSLVAAERRETFHQLPFRIPSYKLKFVTDTEGNLQLAGWELGDSGSHTSNSLLSPQISDGERSVVSPPDQGTVGNKEDSTKQLVEDEIIQLQKDVAHLQLLVVSSRTGGLAENTMLTRHSTRLSEAYEI